MALPYPNSIAEILKTKVNILVTDGAAKGNPGPAGWAYLLLSGEQSLAEEFNGFSTRDTNNRMEMMAVERGLFSAKKHQLKNPLYLLSDSKLLSDALCKWRHAWRRNSWVKADGGQVLHQDLWQKLDPLVDELKPRIYYVEAHRGHPANTRCDRLAVEAASDTESNLYMGALQDYPHFSKLSFTVFYPKPVYLCWRESGEHKEFSDWPPAQAFLKANPAFRVKKIYSPEEIEILLPNH